MQVSQFPPLLLLEYGTCSISDSLLRPVITYDIVAGEIPKTFLIKGISGEFV